MVRREGVLCPRCNTNLDFTYTELDEPDTAVPTRRLEFPPGTIFAERFTIIERVGQGGMGVVYKAIDNALDIEVALKLIQPALAETPHFVEWFRREVRLTRRITHPNICRVHDLGEWDGILYLSMEWIDGETLQQLLKQTGTLRDGRALEIAGKVALALEAAHAKGIVHRDLKPANVMLDRGGQVHVLDFGLAAEHGRSDPAEEGILIGSPYYMAPEQQRREQVDARADFYALGLILREMLLGVRLDPVPGLTREIREVIHPAVLPVLERLLQEDRARRVSEATEARELIRAARDDPEISTVVSTATPAPGSKPGRMRYLGIGAGVVALAIVIAVWLTPGAGPPFATPEARGFYERGRELLAEDADSLAAIRNAITMFNRASDLDPQNARIWAGLAEAEWLRFRRTGDARFRDEAERAVDRALRGDPELPEALYARALGYVEEGKLEAARADLERALDGRPELAIGWAELGLARAAAGDYAGGREALDRALGLAPSSARIHVYDGLFHDQFGEHDVATERYRHATELRSSSLTAWNNYGSGLLRLGRTEEAIAAFERSLEIEDRAEARSNLGTSLYFLGRFDDAVEQYRHALRLDERDATHASNLGDALLMLQRDGEAREAYLEAARRQREQVLVRPLDAVARSDLALYCAQGGDTDCAREETAVALSLQPDSPAILLQAAVAHVLLGETDEALRLLEDAVRHGAGRADVEARPEFERFADDPRYRGILDSAG
jgi:serine/threonine protein kinase/thioredoxin-like negative regulator of GroEL